MCRLRWKVRQPTYSNILMRSKITLTSVRNGTQSVPGLIGHELCFTQYFPTCIWKATKYRLIRGWKPTPPFSSFYRTIRILAYYAFVRWCIKRTIRIHSSLSFRKMTKKEKAATTTSQSPFPIIKAADNIPYGPCNFDTRSGVSA